MIAALVITVTGVVVARDRMTSPPPAPVTIPLIVRNHRPVIEVEVTFPGRQPKTAAMVVDTGGGAVLFTARFLAATNVAGRPAVTASDGQYASLPSPTLKARGAVLPRLKAFTPIRMASDGLDDVDGMLPRAFLSRYDRVTFDFPAQTLQLGGAQPASSVQHRVPATFDDTALITANVDVGGVPQHLVLDTGSVTTHVYRPKATWLDDHPEWPRTIGVASTVALPPGNQRLVATVPHAEIGPISLTDVEILLDDYHLAADGLLGGNVLTGYRLAIDYRDHSVAMSR
jgi:hypothetical protein